MIIKNYNKLIKNTKGKNKRARKLALQLIDAGINAILPRKVLREKVKLKGNTLKIMDNTFNLSRYKRIFVIGGGKASGLMAEEIERILKTRITAGAVNDHLGKNKTKIIKMTKAGHPVPNDNGVKGVKKMFFLLKNMKKTDLVFALISGGGSALMTAPVDGVPLKDLEKMNDALLRSGANIKEVNCVRKHVSQIKGGNLAKKVYPATLVSLIFSDVIGDDLDVIASGCTAPDATTYKNALTIIKNYKMKVPKSVLNHLKKGAKGKIADTPAPGNKVFKNVHNLLLINNYNALEAIKAKAKKLRLNSIILSSVLEGEARDVGISLTGLAEEIVSTGNPVKRPAAIIIGGETTVTVRGHGRGGRNQELVVGAIERLEGLDGAVVLSAGSDGRDGPTDADGGIADGYSFAKMVKKKLCCRQALAQNNVYPFLKKMGDLLMTGATGTNVGDLMVVVVV